MDFVDYIQGVISSQGYYFVNTYKPNFKSVEPVAMS